MNVYIIGLIVYGVIIIALGSWGLGILDGNCKDDVVRNQIRMLLVASSVMVTALVCYMLCKNICFPGDEHIHYIIPLIVAITGGVSVTAFASISKNIKKCTSSERAETYKTVVLYLGIIPSAIMTVGALGILGKRFYKWFQEYNKRKAKYKKEKKDKKERTEKEERRKQSLKEEEEIAAVDVAIQKRERQAMIRGKEKRIANIRGTLKALIKEQKKEVPDPDKLSDTDRAIAKASEELKKAKGELENIRSGKKQSPSFGPNLFWDD